MADWALEIEKDVVNTKESERILTFSINFFILFSFKNHTHSIIQFFRKRRNHLFLKIRPLKRLFFRKISPLTKGQALSLFLAGFVL
jgi:hypothetical protein